jgi:hypothetical protein
MSSGPGRTAVSFGVIATVALLAGCSQSPSTTTVGVPWTLVRSSPASSTVEVEYFHGACDTLPSARVDATDTTVRITVAVKERTGPCADMEVPSYARIRLGGELGNRTIVGSCNESTDGACSSGGQTKLPRDPPVLGS